MNCYYSALQCRRGWFNIGFVIDHNQLWCAEGFPTSFVIVVIYGKEGEKLAWVFKNATTSSKAHICAQFVASGISGKVFHWHSR